MLELPLNGLDKGTIFYFIDGSANCFEISKEEAIIKIAQKIDTVKINGLESLYDDYKTVHAFYAPAGAKSFPVHVDHEDLKILCMEGTKGFEVEGKRYNLKPGEFCLIPAGIEHRAINEFDSVILSMEIDNLAEELEKQENK